MNFRTELVNFKPQIQFSHSDRMLFVGSCFAEHMGSRFKAHKFPVTINPGGIIFHPVPLIQELTRILKRTSLTADDLASRAGVFYSWFHHGSFYAADTDELLAQIQRADEQTFERLTTAQYLFLTFGTAWGYRLQSKGELVANCHKFPVKDFKKELTDADEIYQRLQQFIEDLKRLNPEIKVVLTVSPVRHIRDGLIENNRSKAELLKSVHRLVDEQKSCFYLPSYEWIIDDLRDYRFFGKDLIHPNALAEDYLWEMLTQYYFDAPTQVLNKKIKQVLMGLQHRPIHESTPEHRQFLQQLQQKMNGLMQEEGVDFRVELADLANRIK